MNRFSLNGHGRNTASKPEPPAPAVDHAEMEAVGAWLKTWDDPAPDADAKARLIDALYAEPLAVPTASKQARREKLVSPASLHESSRKGVAVRQAWLIVRAQTRMIGMMTWLASLLVLGLGFVVTVVLQQAYLTGSTSTLPFVLLSPIVSAIGIAFLYGEDSDPALELELAAPISRRVILLARIALVFAFNLTLSLIASIVVTLIAPDSFALSAVILSWLAPMTFLSSLAFLLSVLFFQPLVSVMLSLTIWTVLVARHYFQLPILSDLRLPDLLHVEAYPLLFAAAAICALAAVWLADRESHITHEWGQS